MINIGSLVGTLEFVDNATPKLIALDQQLHRTFGSFVQFQEQTRIFGLGLQQFGSHVARAGDQLTLLTAAITATGVASIKMAAQFESSMVKVVNLTEIGTDQIEDMEKAVMRMGPQLAQGPQELADALYSIGSVGFSGQRALDVLAVSAKASAIGMGETAEVAKAITSAVNNYGEETLNAARAADILTLAVKEGGAEAGNYASTLGRVISTGKTVGVSFEEVNASVATFTRLGVRADEAVTALRGTFALLMKPAEGVKSALVEAGTSIEQVRKSVKERGLADTLIDLVRLFDQNKMSIGEVIPNVRSLAGVLANAGSQADTYRKILHNLETQTGTLNEAFDKTSQTSAFKFQQALSKLQVVGIQLGNVLLPVVTNLAEAMLPLLDVLSKIISAFEYLPEPVQALTLSFVGLSLALGPLMSVFGRMIELGGLFARGFTGLKNIIFGVTDATFKYTDATERGFRAAVKMREAAEAFRRVNITVETIPTVVSSATAANIAIASKAMDDFRVKTVQAQLETTKIAGLLTAAGSPLARFHMGWTLATDSTGNFAKQLLAVNPILDQSAVASRVFYQGINGVSTSLQMASNMTGPFYAGMGGVSNSLQLASAAAAKAAAQFAFVGDAFVPMSRMLPVVTTETQVLTGAIVAQTNALVLYQAALLDVVAAGYTPFVIASAGASKSLDAFNARLIGGGSMKLLSDGAKQANLALIPLEGQLVKVGSSATSAASKIGEVGIVARGLQLLIAGLTGAFSTLGGVLAGIAGAGALFGALGLGAVALTGRLDDLKFTASQIPEIFKDIASIFKDTIVLIGRGLAFAFVELQIAISKFRDTAERTFPTVFKALGDYIDDQFRKVLFVAEVLDRAAKILNKAASASSPEKQALSGAGLDKPITSRQFEQLENERNLLLLDDFNKNVDKLRVNVEKAKAELAKLNPEIKDRMVFALKQGTISVEDIIKANKSWFSSTEVAEIAIKSLGNSTQEAMQTAKRETSWIENFRISAVTLEAELKKAYASGVPVKAIMEQFGNQIETTANKSAMFGKQLGENTSRAFQDFAKFEAQKPFDEMQKRANNLEAIISAAIQQGATIAQVYSVWGDQAVNVADKAEIMGLSVGRNLQALQDFANNKFVNEAFERFKQNLDEIQDRVDRTGLPVEAQKELNEAMQRRATLGKENIQIAINQGKVGHELTRIIDAETRAIYENQKALQDNFKAIRASQYAIEDLQRAFEPDTLETSLQDVTIQFQRMRENISEADKNAENYGKRMQALAAQEMQARKNVLEAWLRGNALTRQDLNKLAVDATMRYEQMKKSGLFAAEDIEKAWKDMVQSTVRSMDQLTGSFVELVGNLPDIISGAFKSMMREASSFKEFFVGIWNSIKDAVFNVFAEIVSRWVRQTLMKMLESLVASQPAFAKAMGGLLGGGGGVDLTGVGQTGVGPGGVRIGGGSIFGDLGGGLGSAGATNWGTVAGGGLMAGSGAAMWAGAGESKWGNTLGGLTTGAGIGTMIMPGIGTIVGAGVGAIVGLISSFFRKSETTRIFEEVGQQLGVNISEGLAKDIATISKNIEGGTKEQRRKLAETLSLSRIIEEGGGLTAANVEKFQKEAMKLFEPIEQGSAQAQMATEELNRVIGLFAAQAEEAGGLWDVQFKQMIERAQELGLEMENLTAAIDAQLNKLAGGVNKMVSGFADPILTALDDLATVDDKRHELQVKAEKLKAQIADMERKGGPSTSVQAHNLAVWKNDLAAINFQLAELDRRQAEAGAKLDELGITGQEAFDRISRITFAAFNAIIAQGKSVFEAMNSIGEAVDKLTLVQQKLGLQTNSAFDALSRFRNLTKENSALLEMAQGLNDVTVALANLGSLTPEIFADLQAEGQGLFDKLVAAGFSVNEALMIMKPQLETILRLHKEQGLAIDENIQKLIDMAIEQGIIDSNMMSTNDILMEGFSAIITALGGELPQAFKDFAEKAKKDINEVNDELDKLTEPRHVKIVPDVNTDDPNWRPDVIRAPEDQRDAETASTGAMVGMHGLRPLHFAGGGGLTEAGKIINFKPRGTDTVPAMLTPGEMVLNQSQQETIANALNARQAGDVNININLDGAIIRNREDAQEIGISIANELRRNPRVREALGEQMINIVSEQRRRPGA